MNILLISECEKRALTQTRRILDQFAERRGQRTWATAITQEGLDTLRRMLRKTARKNTAVACHWIRGHAFTELLWIIGNARAFNPIGAVPTNITGRNVLRKQDEDDWHSATLIRQVSRMAALFHDFGKASNLFQEKLNSDAYVADPWRHEWVSLRLFQAFVGSDSDRDWLGRLAALSNTHATDWQDRLIRDGETANCNRPFESMPPLARLVGWLVVSHHRMLLPKDASTPERFTPERFWGQIDADWNPNNSVRRDAKLAAKCWEFRLDLPDASNQWRKAASELANSILKQPRRFLHQDWSQDPFVVHLSRLSLIFADHFYSRLPAEPTRGDAAYQAYANTDARGSLKQKLDEHLIGVADHSRRIATALTRLELPAIQRRKCFTGRVTVDRFRWQDKAFDLAAGLQYRSTRHGFFGVNMASTGCGKTLANARIMYALADAQRGARFAVALGLRTLTLQTGDAYRERLLLNQDDLAVMIGSSAVRALHDNERDRQRRIRGSESAEALIDDSVNVRFEGILPSGPLSDWLQCNPKLSRMLNAPVLVCTIDHLMPSCESTRGGHQIAPILRLLTSDLVLDEPDDFDLDDLPALSRLVYFAGLFGSRILLSSATLPPALIQGLFEAYRCGRTYFQRHRGEPGLPVDVCCAWFDEYTASASNHSGEAAFELAHAHFVDKRLQNLARKTLIRRQAKIAPAPVSRPRAYASEVIYPLLGSLHGQHHSIDPASGKRVSFGLLRIANIDPLIDIAITLAKLPAPGAARLHVCVYHSRFPLVVRSGIEKLLDRMLNRSESDAIFSDDWLRARLDTSPEIDQIFLVIASPVAEVGRDHDYDWAIVEPSSMRSIIQLSGRVMRHREQACEHPNVLLLDCNIKALTSGGHPAFLRPGFESEKYTLKTHRLQDLLKPEDYQPLSAAPRIKGRAIRDWQNNLVDLEHERLIGRMLEPSDKNEPNIRRSWNSLRWLTALEPQKGSPFRKSQPEEEFVLQPTEDGSDFTMALRLEDGSLSARKEQFSRLRDWAVGERVQTWGAPGYLDALQELVTTSDEPLQSLAQRFGTISLGKTSPPQQWEMHPLLGFRRLRD